MGSVVLFFLFGLFGQTGFRGPCVVDESVRKDRYKKYTIIHVILVEVVPSALCRILMAFCVNFVPSNLSNRKSYKIHGG